MKKRLTSTLLVIVLSALSVASCYGPASGTPSMTPGSSVTPFQSPQAQPVEIISVRDTYQNGQTIEPGGPSIEIGL